MYASSLRAAELILVLDVTVGNGYMECCGLFWSYIWICDLITESVLRFIYYT
jgi:hypothetical protein